MQAFNPYLPSYEYIPDGEPYVFGDRVYVYGSHDKFNGKYFCLNDYVCYSASIDNLAEWRYEGVIFGRADDPRTEQLYLCAPDVCQGKDGNFYFYYTGGNGVVGVAKCATPCGKFEFIGFVKDSTGRTLGQGVGDVNQFDPSIFIDDDGTILLYSGFSTTLSRMITKPHHRKIKSMGGYVAELEEDMLTIKHKPKRILKWAYSPTIGSFKGHAFFEASSMRKINGKYYLIYSSKNMHELNYAISDYPTKGFKYGGTVVSNADIFLNGKGKEGAVNYYNNNHGGMVNIKGQWYIFYHRHTNCHAFSRQGCAEKVFFDKNGHIQQAEITSCGLNDKPLVGKGTYPAYIACNLYIAPHAKQLRGRMRDEFMHIYPYITQDQPDGQVGMQYITKLTNNCVVGFKYFDFNNIKSITLKLRGDFNGSILISTDPADPQNTVPLNINSQEYTNITTPITLPNGTQPLFLKFMGKGKLDFDSFNLD